MKQSRRVSPRVPYDEAVSLTRVDGRGRLFGRSIDLGQAGIYVTCAELCEIGTELVCTVLLPGGPRRLRGRVVRLVALPRAVGIAIKFIELKEADRIVLERLVASRQAAAMPAKLRVGGFEHDLRCEAHVADGDRTMRVLTALPAFLRLDASVDVDVGAGGGPRDVVRPKARGVISRIALDPVSPDGVPRLALDVDIDSTGSGDDSFDEAPPPSGLPRPYKHPLPSVLLSRHLALDLEAAEPVAAPPRRRRAHGTAELPRRAGADMPLVSPPAREPTLRMFALSAPSRGSTRVPTAAWLSLPMLLIGAAIILLSRLAH
jgi:hypothetical protein